MSPIAYFVKISLNKKLSELDKHVHRCSEEIYDELERKGILTLDKMPARFEKTIRKKRLLRERLNAYHR